MKLTRRDAAAAIILLLAALAAFGPILRHGFVFDDFVVIVDNPGIRGLDAARLRWMLTTTYMTAFMPLGWLSFALVHALSGLTPSGFHAASLAVHWLTAVALYAVSRRLLRAQAPAFAAALLFCVHPLQTNTVAFATALPAELAALTFLLAVYCYLGGRVALTFALFLASVLLRWQSFCLPVVLVGLDYWPLGRLRARPGDLFDQKQVRVWAEKAPFVIVAVLAASMIMLAKSQESYAPSFAPSAAARVLWLYPWTLLRPWDYKVAYGLHDGGAGAGVAAALAAFWLWRTRRARPALLLAAAGYAAAVLPSALSAQNGRVFVYLVHGYLACLGLFVLAGSWVRSRRSLAAVCAVSVLLIAASRRELRHWSDPVAFWSRAVAVDPAFSPASAELGRVLLEAGRPAEALPHLAVRLDDAPDDEAAAANMEALGRAAPGLKEEAARHTARAALLRARKSGGLGQ